MWCMWCALLVSCSLVGAADVAPGLEATGTEAPAPRPATIRAPLRTLDRQAAELAWKSWLQSPESGNQNAPPRRITTKSLFITPYVCPKGQRLDRNGCVQVVTVNKDEHERILLEQLQSLFPSSTSGDVIYDYGDDEPGPLQLSIPIGLDPLAAPLQAQEPSAQAQELLMNYVKVDKKEETRPADGSIEAELELLKLQQINGPLNDSIFNNKTNLENPNALNNLLQYPDKPKRDSSTKDNVTSDEGQKELVFGHVNVDPVAYGAQVQAEVTTDFQAKQPEVSTDKKSDSQKLPQPESNTTVAKASTEINVTTTDTVSHENTTQLLKKGDQSGKLNPENDYSDIGEAIKLISRYAEVTTDDNFSKDQKKYAEKDDSVLGTRTKLQYRRNKPKPSDAISQPLLIQPNAAYDNTRPHSYYPKNEPYYRYPVPSQHLQTPLTNYPFRHIQDYWPGRKQFGGVYNAVHENPKRHHHSYPYDYFRLHGNSAYGAHSNQYPKAQVTYLRHIQNYPQRVGHRAVPISSLNNNQDLYSLLGLRHWFSGEGTSKR